MTRSPRCGNYRCVSRFPVAAGESVAWLLELGASARADEERPVLRKGVGAWSSRRARTRMRRAKIRERIEAAAVTAELPGLESIDETLRDRIGDYTHGEAQPAVTMSLRSTRDRTRIGLADDPDREPVAPGRDLGLRERYRACSRARDRPAAREHRHAVAGALHRHEVEARGGAADVDPRRRRERDAAGEDELVGSGHARRLRRDGGDRRRRRSGCRCGGRYVGPERPEES